MGEIILTGQVRMGVSRKKAWNMASNLKDTLTHLHI